MNFILHYTITKDSMTTTTTKGPYDEIDLKFINKYKKFVCDYVEKLAGEYIIMIRPDNDKSASLDAQSKEQLMYIFSKLLYTISEFKGDIPDDTTQLTSFIGNHFSVKTGEYKLFRYLTGATHGLKYNLLGDEIEEKLLEIISEVIDDEELMQYSAELFLLFAKKIADNIANHIWDSTKKITQKPFNGLLRNMNYNNTNPDIFLEIYGFSEYCKTKKK